MAHIPSSNIRLSRGRAVAMTVLQLIDRIYYRSDEGRPTLMVSLYISVAFDTIGHVIIR